MESAKRELDKVPNAAPRGTEEPTDAGPLPDGRERRLRSVVEHSSEIVTIVDPDGTVRYANPAFGRVLGHDPGEAVGTMNVLDHVHPDDLSHVLELTEEALSEVGITSNKAEYRFRHRDGSWRWMESVGTYLLDDPRAGGVVITSRDVTERKEFEERIRFQSGLLDAVGQAVIATDPEGKVLYWNRGAEQLYGWSAEEVMGRPVGSFGVPEELRGRLAEIVEEIRAGKSWSGEFTALRKGGTSVPVMATDSPVYDERGNLSGIIGVSTDLTERKNAEGALVESERRLTNLISNSHAFVYRCLNEPGYPNEYASNQALELTGYTPEDLLVGGGVRFGDLIVEEDRGRVWREVQEALAEGRGFELRYAIRRRDGQVRHVRDHGQGIRGEDAEIVALEGMVYDVTELVDAEERLRESEYRYRTLVERIPAVTFVDRADDSDEPLYVSPQVEWMLGYTPEEWMAGRLWRERLHPDDRERILASDERFEADGGPVDEEYRLLAKDGSVVWVREETVLVRDDGGKPLFVQGILSDVTARRKAEEALQVSEQRFRSSFEDAGIGMAMVSPDGRYLRANRAFCEIVGYAEEELLGMTFREITHPEDLEEDLELKRRVLAGEDRTFSMEKRYVRRDGSSVWVDLTVSMLREPSGEPLYSIAQVQNITGRKRMEEQLQRQALLDPLTGLPNRKLFVDRLGQALERTRRRRGSKVAVLFMDLDGFKVVNDSLGHEVGDMLLTVVAQRLRRSLRPEDTLARFGGDEFVVLIEEVEGSEDAVLVAERITEELGRPFVLEGRGLFASVSIGIGLGDAFSKSREDLLRDADTAMYRAKDERAAYKVFDPAMYERAMVRLELENDLRRGLKAEEFIVHYQPIFDLASGEAWGMEALVRWDHPERGLLNPSEFLPVFEESGLVVPLGEGVLEEACRQAQRWQDDRRTPPLVVSVNLSAVQLSRSDLACTVAETLRMTGLDPRRLSLDITETAYIRALEDKTAALDRLKELGVNISIDDFGVGYSSLAYLKRLPADLLKIDRSFVRGVGEDAGDTSIVRMVIDLAHTLGMKVVAEGVEGRVQAALLAEMGCDLGQGFCFSRPLAPDEVLGFLAG